MLPHARNRLNQRYNHLKFDINAFENDLLDFGRKSKIIKMFIQNDGNHQIIASLDGEKFRFVYDKKTKQIITFLPLIKD